MQNLLQKLKIGMLHQRDIIFNIVFPTIDKRVAKEYEVDSLFGWRWKRIVGIDYIENHSYDVSIRIEECVVSEIWNASYFSKSMVGSNPESPGTRDTSTSLPSTVADFVSEIDLSVVVSLVVKD